MIRLAFAAACACAAVVVAVDASSSRWWSLVYAAVVVALAFGCDQLSPARSSLSRYERWQERDERRAATAVAISVLGSKVE